MLVLLLLLLLDPAWFGICIDFPTDEHVPATTGNHYAHGDHHLTYMQNGQGSVHNAPFDCVPFPICSTPVFASPFQPTMQAWPCRSIG